MALSAPITRTATVQNVADQGGGQVAVMFSVQPKTDANGAVLAAGSNAVLVFDAAEWNEITTQSGAGGANGIGVSLTLTLQ